MSNKDKPLPRPPQTPFGKKRCFKNEELSEEALSDKMDIAMADIGGTLPKEVNVPQNEQEHLDVTIPTGLPDEELINAVMSGDVELLTRLLKKEHAKSQGSPAPETATSEQSTPEDLPKDDYTLSDEEPSTTNSSIEKHTMMKLFKIASENDVSVDWIINRALKLYV
ncbi:hypothetical protein ACFLZI_02510, partial [Nitrospirota bacterium]